MNIQTITNVSDCVPLYLPHSLYLKPLAKFHVSVSLPANKLGKTISNYDIMDKLNNAIKPDKVSVLKVSKSTLEFIRFEGELEDRQKLRNVLARLDGLTFKMSSFTESFKVRASEAKDDFPNRHDWDSFFRDARNMDEMKAGERPDTIHLSNLPIQWFCPRHLENDDGVKPSENIFKRIFEKFGSVRFVDIPICDPYRSQMKTEITGMKTFKFDQEVMFEGYVQFSEYLSFVKAMDEFRGMKLIRKLGDKNQSVNITVTFDKTKHLSDASIKRRNIVRDRLIAKERAKHEEDLKKKKAEEQKLENERKHQEELKQKELEQQREREEKRKEKHLKKLREKGQLDLTNKIRLEEKKLLIAQRKLESIRVLEALFERIKVKDSIKKELDGTQRKQTTKLERNDLRNKLAGKYKSAQEELLNKQKTKLEQVKGKTGLLALIAGNNQLSDRSPSINSISSDDSVLSDSHQTGKAKKRKQKNKKRGNESDTSISSSESESQKAKKIVKPLNPFAALYNPEVAAEIFQQMGMFSYGPQMFPVMAAAAAGMRPGFFPPSYRPNMPYRGGRFPRSRGGGGRGSRGRGQFYGNGNPYDNDQYYKYFKRVGGSNGDYDSEYYNDDHDRHRSDDHDRRRSGSYSRSRSRSRSNRRHRSKSRRSRSRSRRSRSRSHRSRSSRRSRKRSRSKSRSKSKSKLVSTRRSRSSSSGWSRSRSKSRSRSWSRNHKRDDSTPRKVVLQTEKLVRSAKEIQRSVQQKLHERMKADEDKKRRNSEREKSEPSTSKQRSTSVDSAKFMSPKHKAKSTTPEKEWKD